MKCLLNTWYPIAWNTDLKDGEMFARTIADIPLVLFRNSDGGVAALEDMCPHRAAPLSMGKLDNCVVQCPYHGLQFNDQGDCVHNPQGPISKRAQVRHFPTLEKYCAIWVWLGDAEKADPSLLPDFSHMDSEEFYIGMGYLYIEGNYELESDNILDLSHIEFMHPLFSSPAVSAAKPSYEQDGDTVWSRRDIFKDEHAPDFIKQAFGAPDAKSIDRWLHVRWDAPSLMALWAGGLETGEPEEKAVVSAQVHWFSPQTETGTHYFFAMSIPKFLGEDMQQVVENEIVNVAKVFELEDKPIIEAQQKRLGTARLEDKVKVVMPGDGGGVAARRILKRMIDTEASAQA